MSFRSHKKLTPENLSNVASEGKLGRRHPDTIQEEFEHDEFNVSNKAQLGRVKQNMIKLLHQLLRHACI